MITIIGGDFTRSWLSLPLSHGIKVKGGKKPAFGVPSFHETPIWIVSFQKKNTQCWVNRGQAAPQGAGRRINTIPWNLGWYEENWTIE